METLCPDYKKDDWRLFIDSSDGLSRRYDGSQRRCTRLCESSPIRDKQKRPHMSHL